MIRNFAIIAHIDHGKSTLADRLLELTGVVEKGAHDEQMLDRNPISRERGITIKLAPVRMTYKLPITNDQLPINSQLINLQTSLKTDNCKLKISNSEYILNLIDTPGHVDFSYEVDRTLACVEGVVLLVDATQGIQAQTISNAYKALEKDLVIIPVINKIDLPSAQTQKTKQELIDFLGVKNEEIYEVSAKTGEGTEKLLHTIIEKIPAPKKDILPFGFAQGKQNSNINDLQALIFDSYYDSHRGVIAFVRVFSGVMNRKMKVKLAATGQPIEITEVGYFSPELFPADSLQADDIGYVVTNLKDIHQVRVGDTIRTTQSTTGPLSGYKKVKPMVYASIFPTDTGEYLNLKKALEKLYLNDSSIEFTGIHSSALGAGFRVGFLGLLHADVCRERLEREFNLSLVLTPPQVEYLPAGSQGIKDEKGFQEPYLKILIVTPQEYSGAVMQLCENYRARFVTMDNKNQITLTYEMPLSEMISDFFDRLKSISSGYASLDWEFLRYEPVKADKLTLLLNLEPIEEFSEVIVEERSYEKATYLVNRLKDLIPRQQYKVKIQAQYKGKIIASTRLSPFRKNVLMKAGKTLGSGDVGRRNMLLDRQKEGKKKMKMVGKVEVPKEAFLKLFKKS